MRNKNGRLLPKVGIWLLPLLLAVVSCTSFRTATPSPEVVLPTIKPKDRVQIKLEDGTLIRRIKVVEIDPAFLVGTYWSNPSKGTTIFRTSDIRAIQNLKYDVLYVAEINSFVRITMKNGEKVRFKVTGIDREKVESTDRRSRRVINLDEIAKMEVRVGDAGKSVGLVLLVGIVGFVGLIALAFASMSK